MTTLCCSVSVTTPTAAARAQPLIALTVGQEVVAGNATRDVIQTEEGEAGASGLPRCQQPSFCLNIHFVYLNSFFSRGFPQPAGMHVLQADVLALTCVWAGRAAVPGSKATQV